MRQFFLYMILGALLIGWGAQILNSDFGQHIISNTFAFLHVDQTPVDDDELARIKKQIEAEAQAKREHTERMREQMDISGQRERAAAAAEKARADAQRARERAQSQQERMRAQMERMRSRMNR